MKALAELFEFCGCMINFVLHGKSVHVSFMALLLREPANKIVCQKEQRSWKYKVCFAD